MLYLIVTQFYHKLTTLTLTLTLTLTQTNPKHKRTPCSKAILKILNAAKAILKMLKTRGKWFQSGLKNGHNKKN
jgi:hypothetical protein